MVFITLSYLQKIKQSGIWLRVLTNFKLKEIIEIAEKYIIFSPKSIEISYWCVIIIINFYSK